MRSKKLAGMNLLFYGSPGTGKSELARYVARTLNRELICKRSSDLLDQYVGMTERNLAEAFFEAESQEPLLVMDEVDSILAGRDGAQHTWEVSFTNELLAHISPLAPGDFRIVRDRLSLSPSDTVTHEGVLKALEEEAKIEKLHNREKEIGF
jgi:SpoVK/Ycf46/Vps4 family AAA+-type ATPase